MKWLALIALVACKSQPSGSAEHSRAPHAAITVTASLPGASASVIAANVTTPLERQLGGLPKLERMFSRSRYGEMTIWLDFAADVRADDAGGAVQLAINAALVLLPRELPAPPMYSKSGHDLPVLRVALSSDTLPLDALGTQADTIVAQKLAQVAGVGLVSECGAARDDWHVEVDPVALASRGKTLGDVVDEILDMGPPAPGSATQRATFVPGPLVRDVAKVTEGGGLPDCVAYVAGRRAVIVTVRSQPLADRGDTRARLLALIPMIQRQLPAGVAVHVLPDEPLAAFELTGEPDASFPRRNEAARAVAEQLAAASLVELGVDLEGQTSPGTITVRGAGDAAQLRGALERVARDRMLDVREPGDRWVGLTGADPQALHDALGTLVSALGAASLPLHGTLGDDQTPELTLQLDRDSMARLGVDDRDVSQALRAFASDGIVAATIFGQLSTSRVVVTVRDPQLSQLYVRSTSGTIPLDAFVALQRAPQPAVVFHDAQFPWVGVRVGGSRDALDAALAKIPVPAGVHRSVD